MVSKTVDARLTRLEDTVKEKYGRFLQQILDSMSCEHMDLLIADYQEALLGNSHSEAVVLKQMVETMTLGKVSGEYTGPLSVPPKVAQAFLDDSSVALVGECSKCGYLIPGHRGKPPVPCFEACPMCGLDLTTSNTEDTKRG